MAAEVWDAPLEVHAASRGRALWANAVAAQTGRSFLWAPVALTLGIGWYFALGEEPGWPLLGLCSALAAVLLWYARSRPALALPALVLLGLVLATTRASWVAAPVLRTTTGEVLVTGTIERKIGGPVRSILILGVDSIEGLLPVATPRRLRMSTLSRYGDFGVGNRVAFTARLQPLPSPVIPGGFDFGRQLWFEGVGGTGRITGEIKILDAVVPIRLQLAANLLSMRETIGAKVRAAISDRTMAAIAEALINGQRSAIPKQVNTSLQLSGLAHILSISGLHMSLVAGGVFWLVRAILAAFPLLAQHRPIKKWAAGAALVAGLFYLLLAGSDTATLRSYVMIAIVFFAVIVDRPALSVRNLAFAALVILALNPEAAMSASFQMSFMAVLGLAAFYEYWTARHRDRAGEVRVIAGRVRKLAWAVAGAFAAATVTTLIAGTMSSLPAAYHFGRIAPYGIVANGLAVPVVSIVVMPSALAGVLLMPLGLEAWPLWLMGKGLELVLAISDWVAGFPGSGHVVARQPAIAAIVTASGAILVCLLAGWIRFAGLAVVAAGLMLAQFGAAPDILIERTAANVAYRSETGDLVPADPRKGKFAVDKWLIANGEQASMKEAAMRPGWTCDASRCTAQVRGKAVAWFRDEKSTPSCAGVDILIASYPLRGACRAVPLRIDRFDVWRNGAHAITITPAGMEVTTSRSQSGNRPWVTVPQARIRPAAALQH